MAKKKKTQLKPVARGFSTTSVPKKAVLERIPVDTPLSSVENDSPNESTSTPTSELAVVPQLLTDKDGFDPDDVEAQSLQNIVDKYQEKVEKDIRRSVKGVRDDIRLANTNPVLELDEAIVEKVLQMVLQNDVDHSDATGLLDEPEEKLLVRLGLTYGILRRLGFSDARVVQCLHSVHGVDFEEAYDWLTLHCSEDELHPSKGDIDNSHLSGIVPASSRGPQTSQHLSSPGSSSPTHSLHPQSSAPSGHPKPASTDAPKLGPLTKPHSSSNAKGSPVNLATPTEDITPDDDPNIEYVRLRLKIDDASLQKRTGGDLADNRFIERLHTRLEDLKTHYFFNEIYATAEYKKQRKVADDILLRARLRTNEAIHVATSQSSETPQAIHTLPVVETGTNTAETSSPDFFDSENDDGQGMLGLLEDVPEVSVSESGKTFHLRGMSFPRHTAARLPKKYLAGVVSKEDPYAVISYELISGQSKAKRASLSIRWTGGKVDQWVMEDVACPEVDQAEQYISTVALHAVTFPTTNGFCAGALSNAPGSQTFFRTFPPSFRDLWDELELQRKSSNDATNRGIWSQLRTIVESKFSVRDKPAERPSKFVEGRDSMNKRVSGPGRELSSQQIIEAFSSRQSSTAYQEMLTLRNTLPIAR